MMLILPTKGKWFDMILDNIKLDEYREIKPYYTSRLLKYFNAEIIDGQVKYDEKSRQVLFRNGYSSTSRQFIAECTLSVGTGRVDWGAEPNKSYYILHIVNHGELNYGA